MSKDKRKKEVEDATKYGEFVCSYFDWITLDKQREVVSDLENMTKEDNEK